MKTLNMVKVVKGSLQIVDAINGFYLYGNTPDGTVVFLGALGDGVENDLFVGYNPNDDNDLDEAYHFEIVEVDNV